MKKVYYIIYTLFLSFVLLNCFCTFSFGAYPKLVNTITSAFETIESWLLRISTPAAAVAVGSGIFMKMFGVLLLLCLIYIPIISSLGENGLQYPGFLH